MLQGRVSGVLGRVKERIGDWGLRRALYWQLMQLLAKTLGLRLHYVKLGSGSGRLRDAAPPAVPAGYDVRMVGLADLLPFANRIDDLSREFLETVFGRGDTCVATFYEGELVGFSFQSWTRAPVTDQLDILVPDGMKYTYKTWIDSRHRRKNLSQIQGSVRTQAQPDGARERGLWYVETHNYPSLLHGYLHPNHRRLNMGFIGWFSLFGRQIPFRSRAARWLGVELVQKADTRRRQYL